MKTFKLESILTTLSDKASDEIKKFIELNKNKNFLNDINVEKRYFKEALRELDEISLKVLRGDGLVVLKSSMDLDPCEIEVFHWVVSKILGETILQNEQGEHLIHIFDRDPSVGIKDGARYHQTHDTGSLHTDNVNIPENYQYLLVGCVAPAKMGGENIIVSGENIYNFLKENSPEELSILEKDFYWEYRGISKEIFQAPVITRSSEGKVQFRYLRTYLESAHEKAKVALTGDQKRALDTLDTALSMSKFQLNYRLNAGEILILNDSEFFHDRRTFVDHQESISLNDFKNGKAGKLKRTLLRTWVRSA